MFIVVVSVVCFIPGFLSSRAITNHSEHTEFATQAAEAEMEHWRQSGYTGLPAIPAGQTSVMTKLALANPLPNGSGSVKFTYLDPNLSATSTNSGRKEIDVTVGWSDGPNDTGTVTLSSLVVQGGI